MPGSLQPSHLSAQLRPSLLLSTVAEAQADTHCPARENVETNRTYTVHVEFYYLRAAFRGRERRQSQSYYILRFQYGLKITEITYPPPQNNSCFYCWLLSRFKVSEKRFDSSDFKLKISPYVMDIWRKKFLGFTTTRIGAAPEMPSSLPSTGPAW